jgi:hypothetical protein
VTPRGKCTRCGSEFTAVDFHDFLSEIEWHAVACGINDDRVLYFRITGETQPVAQ